MPTLPSSIRRSLKAFPINRAQLVENLNGTIIANMRHAHSPTMGRGVATSIDGGKSFGPIAYDKQLVASVCQATIIRSAQNGSAYPPFALPRQMSRPS